MDGFPPLEEILKRNPPAFIMLTDSAGDPCIVPVDNIAVAWIGPSGYTQVFLKQSAGDMAKWLNVTQTPKEIYRMLTNS